jgi:hypothetical protein
VKLSQQAEARESLQHAQGKCCTANATSGQAQRSKIGLAPIDCFNGCARIGWERKFRQDLPQLAPAAPRRNPADRPGQCPDHCFQARSWQSTPRRSPYLCCESSIYRTLRIIVKLVIPRAQTDGGCAGEFQ